MRLQTEHNHFRTYGKFELHPVFFCHHAPSPSAVLAAVSFKLRTLTLSFFLVLLLFLTLNLNLSLTHIVLQAAWRDCKPGPLALAATDAYGRPRTGGHGPCIG